MRPRTDLNRKIYFSLSNSSSLASRSVATPPEITSRTPAIHWHFSGYDSEPMPIMERISDNHDSAGRAHARKPVAVWCSSRPAILALGSPQMGNAPRRGRAMNFASSHQAEQPRGLRCCARRSLVAPVIEPIACCVLRPSRHFRILDRREPVHVPFAPWTTWDRRQPR